MRVLVRQMGNRAFGEVLDAATGEPIDGVLSVDIKLQPAQPPKATMVVWADVEIEADATIERRAIYPQTCVVCGKSFRFDGYLACAGCRDRQIPLEINGG